MFVKRFLLCALAAVCAASLLAPTAFAHGGCHGRAARRTAQPCAVEDCTRAGWHYHDRTLYCGHTHGGNGLCDGSCVSLCEVEGCETAGRHEHGGVTYCGNNHDCGYCDGACLPLCEVEGCEIAGRHEHGGVAYCGSDHSCGWCDGSCLSYSGAACGGRHGCHR